LEERDPVPSGGGGISRHPRLLAHHNPFILLASEAKILRLDISIGSCVEASVEIGLVGQGVPPKQGQPEEGTTSILLLLGEVEILLVDLILEGGQRGMLRVES
jgi:hypothetical protein